MVLIDDKIRWICERGHHIVLGLFHVLWEEVRNVFEIFHHVFNHGQRNIGFVAEPMSSVHWWDSGDHPQKFLADLIELLN